MAQQRDTQKRNGAKTPLRKRKAAPGQFKGDTGDRIKISDAASAKIIHLSGHQMPQRTTRQDVRRSSKTPASAIDTLIGVLGTEVTIAIGISRGLMETLTRFQDYLIAIDKEIEEGDIAQVKAIALKQIAHLRATVLAASADLRRVMPDACSHIVDALPIDRSDIVYS